MKFILILFISLLFSGCIYSNPCGLSTYNYNDCKEYYDSMGIYHKVCPKNNIWNSCDKKPTIEDCINCN